MEHMNEYEIKYCLKIIEDMMQAPLYKEFFLTKDNLSKPKIVQNKEKINRITQTLRNGIYASKARWLQDMRSFFQALSDDFREDSLSFCIVAYFSDLFESKVKFIPKNQDDEFYQRFAEIQVRAKNLLESMPNKS